ncbi:MAG: hypothetical protein PHU23_18325, partial [Dehalococcoidales bacterium]|nr:hypothetical protein [Dehalococcoidales bacterium]
MSKLKCIGCRHLTRETQPQDNTNPRSPAVVYGCELERLPYWTGLNGLLRPGKGTITGAAECPVDVSS